MYIACFLIAIHCQHCQALIPNASPLPHSTNVCCLFSNCYPSPTLSNANDQCCHSPQPSLQCDCYVHLPTTLLSSYATAIECHHHPWMPPPTANVVSHLNFSPLLPHCHLSSPSNYAACCHHLPPPLLRSILATFALPPLAVVNNCVHKKPSNAATALDCFRPLQTAKSGCKQWWWETSDDGSDGDGSSSGWWLLAAAVGNGAQH